MICDTNYKICFIYYPELCLEFGTFRECSVIYTLQMQPNGHHEADVAQHSIEKYNCFGKVAGSTPAVVIFFAHVAGGGEEQTNCLVGGSLAGKNNGCGVPRGPGQ